MTKEEAIEAIKEAYGNSEYTDEIIKALEQEPKTVLYSGDGYADGYIVYDIAECPNCGYEYEDGDNFCPHCGQSLR